MREQSRPAKNFLGKMTRTRPGVHDQKKKLDFILPQCILSYRKYISHIKSKPVAGSRARENRRGLCGFFEFVGHDGPRFVS